MDRDIATQEMLADAAKRSEKIPQASPHPFGRIGMDFKDIVCIIITRPFLVAVCNRGMLALDACVRFVFVGKNMAVRPGKAMHMFGQCLGLCGVNHPQSNLSARPSNRAQDGRTIIGVCASTAPFVGTPTGRPMRTDALLTFFPPHFGRVHRSRLPNRGRASLVVNVQRFVGVLAVNSERSGSSVPIPRPIRSWSRLSGCHATAKPLVVA